uniref:MD-2-related lipid-recognition domain-containing protein n=1 Tax=Schizaphis graminum TaxID=13262 RepID=A0A2S2NUC0_SCHGA
MQNSKINVAWHTNSSSSLKNTVGFVEFLETIENNNFQVRIETHHKGISNSIKVPSLSVQRTDLCAYISTDLLFVPLVRQVFDLGKCPIAKGKHIIYKDTLVSKYRPYIPFGCWILITRITKRDIPFTCFNITLQSLPSLKSEPYQCI